MTRPLEAVIDFKKAAIQYSLSQALIFQQLPPADLERIASYTTLRGLARHEYLFRQHDPVFGFFIVRSGLVNVHRINADQQEQVVHLIHPGESFAERALTSLSGYPVHARAVEESEVIVIPSEEFKQHQKESPDLAWGMISSIDKHLCSLVTTLEGLQLKDVELRLLHWLLQHVSSHQSTEAIEVFLEITKKELAATLAISRETLSRLLKKLQNASMIKVKLRSVIILNPSWLHDYFQKRRLHLNAANDACLEA